MHVIDHGLDNVPFKLLVDLFMCFRQDICLEKVTVQCGHCSQVLLMIQIAFPVMKLKALLYNSCSFHKLA